MKRYRFRKNERGYSEAAFRFMRQTVPRTVRYLANPRMINVQNMPLTGPCFIYANHSSNLDPFLINQEMSHEPTAGVMTRYQFFNTLPRIFMGSIGVIPNSKYVPEPGVIRSVMRMIDQRRMILIFPEGGRRWDGRPKPLIAATLKLFWKMRIPIHAVQIHGSYLSWPRWADRPRRNSMALHWLHPLNPGDFPDYESFAITCRKLIGFDENDPPADTLPTSAWKPALGIQRILYRCPLTGMPEAVYTPDGHIVKSRATDDFLYRMDKDSRLWNNNGELVSVAELFDRINVIPLQTDKKQIIIPDTPCKLYHIDRNYALHHLGRAYIRMEIGQVIIQNGSNRYDLPLEKIRYISIEKNHKLVLTTLQTSYMVDLGKKSVLQWQIYIRRLQCNEKPETSL